MKITRLAAFAIPALCCAVICLATAPMAHSQDLTVAGLYDFCPKLGCADGANPEAGLTVGPDGTLYGTTYGLFQINGTYGPGSVYKITPEGAFTLLHTFCTVGPRGGNYCEDGDNADSTLLLGTDGYLYGTNRDGGTGPYQFSGGGGTVFQITSSGTLKTLYSFCALEFCTDGLIPSGSLVQDAEGYLYGTTGYEASSSSTVAYGTVYRISTTGSFTSLYTFCKTKGCPDGYAPVAGLIAGPEGNFYGTTTLGGAHKSGTVFSITSDGQLTTLYSFCSITNSANACLDGSIPNGLVLGRDGNFYGTTQQGGLSRSGGTVFRITTGGMLTTLYSFCATVNPCTDGYEPTGNLFEALDGDIYGIAGNLFRLTPSGSVEILHAFCPTSVPCGETAGSVAGFVQGANGALYGASPAPEGGGGSVYAIYGLTGTLKPAKVSLGATPDPPSAGQTVTLTATVAGGSGTPDGTVYFTANGTTLCSTVLSSGGASCKVATEGMKPGNYQVVAQYSGSETYNGANDIAIATLNPAPTSTVFGVSPTSATVPSAVTLTAIVQRIVGKNAGLPTGSVSFYYGGYLIGTASLQEQNSTSEVATFTGSTAGFAPGNYNLIAHYNGDTYDAPSNSVVQTLTLK